ncbi:MAG: Asp23/Gls24 family envelope stress response protein [Lachnospiraceae bacterium]|nr:Asp23/Gls24 family envelope stress response protein [Lachnospiraceae bacterium]
MAEEKILNDEKFTVNAEGAGIIEIADDVVSSIVGLAVTEVDGVAQLSGDITRDLIAKLGKKTLSKGIRISYEEKSVLVDVALVIKFGFNIVEVSKNVQEKVKTTLETMTGLTCRQVNVKIAGIDFGA